MQMWLNILLSFNQASQDIKIADDPDQDYKPRCSLIAYTQ